MASKKKNAQKEIAVMEPIETDIELDLDTEEDWGAADLEELPPDPVEEEDNAYGFDDEDESLIEQDEEPLFDVEAEPTAIEEATTPEAFAELATPIAAPPAPGGVKIVNGISSTLYNRMRKELKETPHRLTIDAAVKHIKPLLASGKMSGMTNTDIEEQIHVMWGGVKSEDDLWSHTSYTWFINVSDRAKTRLYNAVRAQLIA